MSNLSLSSLSESELSSDNELRLDGVSLDRLVCRRLGGALGGSCFLRSFRAKLATGVTFADVIKFSVDKLATTLLMLLGGTASPLSVMFLLPFLNSGSDCMAICCLPAARFVPSTCPVLGKSSRLAFGVEVETGAEMTA